MKIKMPLLICHYFVSLAFFCGAFFRCCSRSSCIGPSLGDKYCVVCGFFQQKPNRMERCSLVRSLSFMPTSQSVVYMAHIAHFFCRLACATFSFNIHVMRWVLRSFFSLLVSLVCRLDFVLGPECSRNIHGDNSILWSHTNSVRCSKQRWKKNSTPSPSIYSASVTQYILHVSRSFAICRNATSNGNRNGTEHEPEQQPAAFASLKTHYAPISFRPMHTQNKPKIVVYISVGAARYATTETQ